MNIVKIFLFIILGALLGATFAFLFTQHKKPVQAPSQNTATLLPITKSVETAFLRTSDKLAFQMNELCATLANDQSFALKLFVENDATSPEVSDFAGKFIGPMGLAILEITDSANIILSSGPNGNPIGSAATANQTALSDGEVVCTDELISGRSMIVLWYKKKVSIADATLYVRGGIILDDVFLDALKPLATVGIGIKRGNSIAVRGVGTHKDAALTNGQLQLNNEMYAVDTIALPYRGNGVVPNLLILAKSPEL